MLCVNCSKLSFLNTKKHCIRCDGDVYNNISVLCEICSNTEKVCSVCIKKTQNISKIKSFNVGCHSCGSK
jgi:hypothetical protein